MNDVKKINQRFFFTLVLFIFIILLGIGAMILSNLFIPNVDLQYVIYFVSLIGMIVAGGMFQTRFTRLTNTAYLIKIRHHASPALPMRHTLKLDQMPSVLKEQGYTRYAVDQSHTLFYRVTKDTIKRMLTKYMLEVVVLIEGHIDEFYLSAVDEEINRIQETYLKERKRMERILITQIKPIHDLSVETKDKIKEIFFLKTREVSLFLRARSTVISTINVGLHKPSNTALMLYSDTYSPSLYYTHHIEQIKSML